MSSGTRAEYFFYFRTSVKILFLFTTILTVSLCIFEVMELDSRLTFPDSNDIVESRTFHVENGDYCRLSIGSVDNNWLLLKITTNATSYVYVRGTTDGDLKQYNTNHLVVECENWFIVTVRPYQDSQVNIEWAYYEQEDVESVHDSNSMIPQPILLLLTILVNFTSIVALWRSRLTIVG